MSADYEQVQQCTLGQGDDVRNSQLDAALPRRPTQRLIIFPLPG